jgi:hypothetical protein
MTWQWLNTVNRVNTQVKKVRPAVSGGSCCFLTLFTSFAVDFDPMLRYHSPCREYIRRGLGATRKTVESV